MSPLRSEPGRTRWVPCGAACLPTHRARLGLPRFGCWFYFEVRSHEQGRAPEPWYPPSAAAREAPPNRLHAGQAEQVGEGRRHLELPTGYEGPAVDDRPENRLAVVLDEELRATGRTGWSTPSVFGLRTVRQPDARPDRGRERTP